MALADYNLRYELIFDDIDSHGWKVEIYDRDEAGAVERLYGTGNPVGIYYESDDKITKGIIGSECRISLYGTPNMSQLEFGGGSDLSQFYTDDEERFYVKVLYRNERAEDGSIGEYLTYWVGFLYQDEYREHITSDPYQVDLVAIDRFGLMKNKRMQSIEYLSQPIHGDRVLGLDDLINIFVQETKLELPIVGGTGLVTEQAVVDSFLEDQAITCQSFFKSEKDFYEMETLYDVVDSLMKSTFCVMYQRLGKLVIEPIDSNATLTKLSIPKEAIPLGNNLYARHLVATRATTYSYRIGSRNLLENGSFERDAVGTNDPLNWVIPSGTYMDEQKMEVTDELYQDGSTQSFKVATDNGVSDSTFDNASGADKINLYTMFQQSSLDINQTTGLFDDKLKGLIRFGFFFANITDSDLKIRLSLERLDYSGSTEYYDWDTGLWRSGAVYYGEYTAKSSGDWEEVELFYNLPTYPSTGTVDFPNPPIVLRIHAMDWDENAAGINNGDVVVYFDNFFMGLYNDSNESRGGIDYDTEYYNTIQFDDVDTKVDEQEIECLFGIAGASTNGSIDGSFFVTNQIPILGNKIRGMYWNRYTAGFTGSRVRDDFNSVGGGNTFVELPTYIMARRRNFDQSSKRLIEGSFKLAARKNPINGIDIPWKPVSYGEPIKLEFNSFTDVVSHYRMVRFDFSPRENEYNFSAVDYVQLPIV